MITDKFDEFTESIVSVFSDVLLSHILDSRIEIIKQYRQICRAFGCKWNENLDVEASEEGIEECEVVVESLRILDIHCFDNWMLLGEGIIARSGKFINLFYVHVDCSN